MSVEAKYWTEAKATGGGRNGLSGLVNGQLTVTMTSPKELGGSGLGHNPEELFAVGYAACYLGAMRFAATSEKLMDTTVKPISPEPLIAASRLPKPASKCR